MNTSMEKYIMAIHIMTKVCKEHSEWQEKVNGEYYE